MSQRKRTNPSSKNYLHAVSFGSVIVHRLLQELELFSTPNATSSLIDKVVLESPISFRPVTFVQHAKKENLVFLNLVFACADCPRCRTDMGDPVIFIARLRESWKIIDRPCLDWIRSLGGDEQKWLLLFNSRIFDYFPSELVGWAFRFIILPIFSCLHDCRQTIELLKILARNRPDPQEARHNLFVHMIYSKRDVFVPGPSATTFQQAIECDLRNYLQEGESLIFSNHYGYYKFLDLVPTLPPYNIASSLTRFDASKVLILHGKLDLISPFLNAMEWRDLFTRGTAAHLLLLDHKGHCDFFSPNDDILLMVKDFLWDSLDSQKLQRFLMTKARGESSFFDPPDWNAYDLTEEVFDVLYNDNKMEIY